MGRFAVHPVTVLGHLPGRTGVEGPGQNSRCPGSDSQWIPLEGLPRASVCSADRCS
jgi:hypothetical protein